MTDLGCAKYFGPETSESEFPVFEKELPPLEGDELYKTVNQQTVALGTPAYMSPEFADLKVRRPGEKRGDFDMRKDEKTGYDAF